MMLTGLLLAIMLVVVALVVDIGHTRLVQRQLQAGVDAAALAGAQELPVADLAEQTADEYSPSNGEKNELNTIKGATTTTTVRCIPSIPGCNTRYATANAVTVEATAQVPTFFARIIGVDSLNVAAKATACFPCSVRPLDIMLILDRTGSMCAGGPNDSPNSDPQVCRDLSAALEGVSTFISVMDPKLDRVGLALTPPAVGPRAGQGDSPSDACAKPASSNYYGFDTWAPWWDTAASTGYRGQDRAFYVVSSLSDDDVDNNPADDYVIEDADGNWDLNPASDIVSKLGCVKAAGGTSYVVAIDEAARELAEHGRPDVQDVIVFFTDGGANTTHDDGTHWSGNSPWFNRPCGSGVQAANNAKQVSDTEGRYTAIYTIGYDLENQSAASQRCQRPQSNGHQNTSGSAQAESAQTWGRTPQEALTAMASVPENFYYTADPDELQQLFLRVAGEVLASAARLVDNDLQDLVE
jgi:hypothetical protein